MKKEKLPEKVDNNLKRILKRFKQLKGQHIITQSWKIERLIAISTDNEDYYYVTYDGRKITMNSCVGRIIQLKGKINDDDYNDMVRTAKLNDFDQTIKNKNDVNNYKKELLKIFDDDKEKLLTEVCWEVK